MEAAANSHSEGTKLSDNGKERTERDNHFQNSSSKVTLSLSDIDEVYYFVVLGVIFFCFCCIVGVGDPMPSMKQTSREFST